MAGLDIGIAGCGIAGLSAALLLHRQGHRVTLYDRFEEPRPLGAGLMIQPTGLAVLDRLGLARRVAAAGAPIARLHGRNAQGRVVLDARYADMRQAGVFGLGIHRASLFGALHEAVCAEGIAICTEAEVAGTELDGAGRRFRLADGTHSPVHELIVDASGLHSALAAPCGKWLGYGALWTTLHWPEDGPFDATVLEQRYRAARQMIGVLPVGQGRLCLFWSLRADRYDAWQEAGLAAWKDEACRLWPACEGLLGQIADPGQLTFARYAHRLLPQPLGERIVHIGDAWHSASPQLGQGANMALLDAWALAQGLAQPGPLERRLGHAIALRRGHVRLYQWLTALFTPLYQSDAALPAIFRDRILAPVSRIPPADRIQGLLVGGLAGSPLDRLGLAMPDYAGLADDQCASTVAVPLR
ncbi:MAG: FAD-dependent monooxygenase [Novosphingobium sp.]|nr:FAD-dependent monooxygenase [Novosphingobium sp.]MBO9601429.1 FAD-dependent monooxygenase [Novosphingobium sp.]